jgi:dTDP-4-amino-4,6-dideoxygalactose transaminase
MIPFIDLRSQYADLKSVLDPAILGVLAHGQYVLGPEVGQLERELADYVGVRHAISCASGTDALVIALRAKGIGPGDGVLTSPFTFMASAEAISLVGATPVFVDVHPDTFNIDPAALRKSLNECSAPHPSLAPKAIIGVDLFGQAADYPALNAIAAEHGLFVIEDAAQSFGATQDGTRAGKLAEIGCTSFFPAKPLGCYGDGGALFTDDDDLAALFKSIRVHGQGLDRYEHVRIGLTSRLDTIQAAVLIAKLSLFDQELANRQKIAGWYDEAIRKAGLPLRTPSISAGNTSAWAQYTIVATDAEARKTFMARLVEAQVPTMIYYPKPLHLQKAFENLAHKPGDFPVSESLSQKVFSLPMHPYLERDQVEQIVAAIAA